MLGTGKKVLVVDDEVHIVHVVSIKLRNNGYDVIPASNGTEAFELALEESPDIVITDFQMPVMTGLEFVEKLRQNKQTRDIPVIMLTARDFAIEDEQRQDLKISEFLSKPFSPKELLRSVEDILYRKSVVEDKEATLSPGKTGAE